jgi:hypothetical protein
MLQSTIALLLYLSPKMRVRIMQVQAVSMAGAL